MKRLSRMKSLFPVVLITCLIGCQKSGSNSQNPKPDAPNIPSVAEVPPSLSVADIEGSSWEANMSKVQGKSRSEKIYRYDFKTDGSFVLNTRPVKEMEEDSSKIFSALTRDMGGTWTVEGAQIQVQMQIMGKQVKDTFEIRGTDLYYHGEKMTRL